MPSIMRAENSLDLTARVDLKKTIEKTLIWHTEMIAIADEKSLSNSN